MHATHRACSLLLDVSEESFRIAFTNIISTPSPNTPWHRTSITSTTLLSDTQSFPLTSHSHHPFHHSSPTPISNSITSIHLPQYLPLHHFHFLTSTKIAPLPPTPSLPLPPLAILSLTSSPLPQRRRSFHSCSRWCSSWSRCSRPRLTRRRRLSPTSLPLALQEAPPCLFNRSSPILCLTIQPPPLQEVLPLQKSHTTPTLPLLQHLSLTPLHLYRPLASPSSGDGCLRPGLRRDGCRGGVPPIL